jgi:HAD superfamily hydrolase (TIGR01509 family)
MRFKVVILDWDATLVESLEPHFEAYGLAAEKLGMRIDMKKIRYAAGMTAPEIVRTIFPVKDEEQIKEIVMLKDEIFRDELWKQVKAFPGAQEMLDTLKSKTILAIATSSSILNVTPVMDKLQWKEYFSTIMAREHIKKGKPDPEILLKVCEKVGVKPVDAVYVGDSVHDMAAAEDAGMISIGVPTGTHSKQELEKAGADRVFENLFEVKSFLMET